MYPAALNVNDARKALQCNGLSGHLGFLGSAVVIISGGKYYIELGGHSSCCLNTEDIFLYI